MEGIRKTLKSYYFIDSLAVVLIIDGASYAYYQIYIKEGTLVLQVILVECFLLWKNL